MELVLADIQRVDSIASLLIRIGLAFVFGYAAISMAISPESYLHYVPPFIKEIINPIAFLHMFGAFEIGLSLWLLSGRGKLYAAGIAFLTIFMLTVVNIDSFATVFRNVAIILSALALVFIEWEYSR